jgi:hypothetical protein
VTGWFAVVTAAALTASAAQLPLVNARVETRSATQGLQRELQTIRDSGTAVWAAYRVPIVESPRGQVSYAGQMWPMGTFGSCRLEPATELIVLARFDARELIELRAQPVDCDLNAAGASVVSLEGVRPEESVSWLSTLIGRVAGGGSNDRIERAALTALALHAAPAAAGTLVEVARNGATTNLRGQALVRLAQRASERLAASVADAVDRDPEVEVKKQAVVALSRLPRDEGVPQLIELAKGHRSVDVRRQAIIQLGQSRDPRAVDFFAQLLVK